MKIISLLPYNYGIPNRKNNMSLPFKMSSEFPKINKEEVIDIFENLVKIPSPPLKESKVADWILSFCKQNKIKAILDKYQNVKLKIPPTDKTKQSLLFSAHMDVVGDDSPVNIINDGEFIKTDGKRTLGADDKSGVAAALLLAKEFSNTNTKHGGLEMLFTRDEELGMTGIINADLQDAGSKYVFVLDEARLGRFDNSGANYTTVLISIKTPFGGHSGLDIGDKSRLNAVKLISELMSEIPQGVFFEDESGVVTSINHGTIIAGDIQNNASKIVEDKFVSKNYLDYFIKNSVTNVINTNAMASLSIRSSNREKEKELIQKLKDIIEKFNQKYSGLAAASIRFEELMPIFENDDNSAIENIYKEACASVNLKPCIGTFHAGAETHIFMNRTNKNNEKFKPILLGIADIFDMHSAKEKINIQSLKKGYELIRATFLKFNESNKT